MMKFPDGCVEVVTDPKIVLKDKKGGSSKITFHNSNKIEVKKIVIDGCVIKDGVKCDYMVITTHNGYEYYVELKGHHVDHALEQIKRTIALVSVNPQKTIKHCFIVCTRSPKMDPKMQDIKLSFKRQYNSTLTIKSQHHEHTL